MERPHSTKPIAAWGRCHCLTILENDASGDKITLPKAEVQVRLGVGGGLGGLVSTERNLQLRWSLAPMPRGKDRRKSKTLQA